MIRWLRDKLRSRRRGNILVQPRDDEEPTGLTRHDEPLTEAEYEELKARWERQHAGPRHARRRRDTP